MVHFQDYPYPGQQMQYYSNDPDPDRTKKHRSRDNAESLLALLFDDFDNLGEGADAFQEYFIRHIDGRALNTEGEKERVIKCLEAAIERRVCEGLKLELCAENRVGLLSDISRVLRENGLTVVRADVETQGENSLNAFYVRDISGNKIDMEFVESVKKEMRPIHLKVKNEETTDTVGSHIPVASAAIQPQSKSHRFSLADILRSQMERLSLNFVPTK